MLVLELGFKQKFIILTVAHLNRGKAEICSDIQIERPKHL